MSSSSTAADWRDVILTHQERMKYLLESGHKWDVQFLVGNEASGKELIKAHKFVLDVFGSEVFEGQFRTNEMIGQANEKPIEVIDLDPEAFKAMLRFLYTDDLAGINKENVAGVLAAAKKYMLKPFAEKCVEMAIKMLDIENVLGIWIVAKLHEEKALVDQCLLFIDENIAEIVDTEEFLALDKKQIVVLFGRNTFQCDELTLFQGAMKRPISIYFALKLDRWAQKQCMEQGKKPTGAEKRAAMGLALFAIRFPLINLTDFGDHIFLTNILNAEEKAAILAHNSTEINAAVKAQIPMPFFANCRSIIPRYNNWDVHKCGPKLTIMNGSVLTHTGNRDGGENCIHATLPICPFKMTAHYYPHIAAYFEAQILKKSSNWIAIGFCDCEFPLHGKDVGKMNNSMGIWKNGEIWIDGEKNPIGIYKSSDFDVDDVFGIGLIQSSANSSIKCFASCNGKLMGSIELPTKFMDIKLYPAVSLYKQGDSVKTNFGKEKWRYNPLELLQ